MNLQKQHACKVKGKDYYKYVMVVPSKIIKQLKWKDKEELQAEVKDGKLVVNKT